MEPSAAAFLLVTRANGAGASPSDAASWLHRALVLQHRNRELLAAAYELGRRHRSTDPVSFDRNWTLNAGGSIPDCLTVKPSLLSTARAWIGTDTYSAERDYLSAHPELLDPAADLAVAEALLGVSEQEANRYNALRETAQRDGTEAAYRPLLLYILVYEFTMSGNADQRALLANRREELLTDTVARTLSEWAERDDDLVSAALRAAALLDRARAGNDEPV
jgi:hypothetical protein